MRIINKIINALFDLIWIPFDNFDPFLSIVAVSFITGIIASLIYRFTANQKAIGNLNRKIKGYILELRIFDFDPRSIISSLKNISKNFFVYLYYSIKPMLLLFIPVVIILIQLHYRYGYSALKPGDVTIVTVKLNEKVDLLNSKIDLEISGNLKILSSPVRIPLRHEISWKISADDYGEGKLTVKINKNQYEKIVVISKKQKKIVPSSVNGSLLNLIKNLGGDYIPEDEIIKSINVQYPDGSVLFLGMGINWIIIFLLFSLISGGLIMKIYGIEW